MNPRWSRPVAGFLLATLFSAFFACDLCAQSGLEKKKIQDASRRVARAMERGTGAERMRDVDELLATGEPWAVPIIANGIGISYKRTEQMSRRVLSMMERNADLYKRLKIQPPQRRGDRTANDEINGNLDLIERLQELQTEERRFRSDALKATRAMVVRLEPERKQRLADLVVANLRSAKGEYRLALIDVVGRIGLPVATEAAADIIQSNPDQVLRLASIDALGESGDESAAEVLLPFLQDPRWQIRVAVVDALRKLRKKVAIPALIEAMGREEGRVREDVLAALQEMTGVDKADNPAVWRNWWNENKDNPLPPRVARPAGGPGAVARGGGRGQPGGAPRGGTSFYGIQTRSKHIVYILDHSGSMLTAASSGESTGNAGTAGLTKIDVAKIELWKSIEGLAPDATFNILFYNHEWRIFQESMVKANAANKRAAKEYIDGIKAESSTNIYDTLERAFQIGGQGAVDKAYKVNFDTIFFLTDGSPTSGKTTDVNEILAEVERWNQAKRIKVHCVGIGPHNAPFLQRLARQTGGDYTTRG